MKKLALILGIVLLLSSCAWTPDKMTWLRSQGYEVLYQVDDRGSATNTDGNVFVIANKEGQVGIATCSVIFRYRIPRLTKIIWLNYVITYKEYKPTTQE